MLKVSVACLKSVINVMRDKLVRFRVRVARANASRNRPEVRIRCVIESKQLLFRGIPRKNAY